MDKKIKVLMVDDEAQFRATTNKILTRRGFDTIMAESGEEALTQLSKNPDVIILDIKMPGMDGHETLLEIRKVKPDIPVIMLTGHATVETAIDGMKLGAFDYLMKPCDIDLLLSKVTDAASKKRKHEEKIVEARIKEITQRQI